MGKTRRDSLVGTSGWSYTHWKGPFYPPDIKDEDMLRYYCQHFKSVEINSSFYHLPSREVLMNWRNATPDDFVFSVKASRYITHMKKLNDPGESLDLLFERITVLEKKLGPILFQLPPNWHYNHERLSHFLETLSPEFRCAFEFRDRSWLNQRCYDLLASYGAALCLYELDGYLSPRLVTADFVYIRLHGPNGAYRGCYDTRTLADWAGAFSAWSANKKDVYCYFDNDEAGYAAQNARKLLDMLRKG